MYALPHCLLNAFVHALSECHAFYTVCGGIDLQFTGIVLYVRKSKLFHFFQIFYTPENTTLALERTMHSKYQLYLASKTNYLKVSFLSIFGTALTDSQNMAKERAIIMFRPLRTLYPRACFTRENSARKGTNERKRMTAAGCRHRSLPRRGGYPELLSQLTRTGTLSDL